MANKRYDQFTTLTPTPDRIILHADPATGELNKAPLSDVGSNSFQRINQIVVPESNVSTGGENMMYYELPANTLQTIGDTIKGEYSVEQRNPTSTNQYSVAIGGTTVVGPTLSEEHLMIIKWTIILIAVNTITLYTEFQINTNVTTVLNAGSVTVDETDLIGTFIRVDANEVGNVDFYCSTIDLIKGV